MNIVIFLNILLLNINEVEITDVYENKYLELLEENSILKEKVNELMIVVDKQNLNIKELIKENKEVISSLQNEILLLKELNIVEEKDTINDDANIKQKIIIIILIMTLIAVFWGLKESYN